ncbi:hypothetical protein DFLDMN_004991 [Cupriavidus sp. H19C3]
MEEKGSQWRRPANGGGQPTEEKASHCVPGAGRQADAILPGGTRCVVVA